MRPSIFDTDNWREIIATLSRNKIRTFMTAFGIFWGTAIMTICWGGGKGFQGLMNRNFAGLSANTGGIFASTTSKPYAGFSKGRAWRITDTDIDMIRSNFPSIDQSTTILQISNAKTTYGSNSTTSTLIGTDPEFFTLQRHALLEGRYLIESDCHSRGKVCVIGSTLAAKLFPDKSPLGEFVVADGSAYCVVGVATRISEAYIAGDVEQSLVIPQSTLRSTYNILYPGFLLFTTEPGSKPGDIIPRIKNLLKANHKIAPDDEDAIDSMDLSESFEIIDKVYRGIELVVLFVGLGTLLAGVIGVGNIMWIIVKERTTEFGIRRAIGATPGDLILQILSESVVLTTLAGLTGVSFATLILYGLDQHNYDQWLGAPGFVISFHAAVAILILFIVLGTLAGIAPALKAMHIKPVEAINAK